MRTELLFGSEGMEKLKNAKVALFGVGGVGGYVAKHLHAAVSETWCLQITTV